MPHRPDRVATYPGFFSNLTLGKTGQLAGGVRTGHAPPIFIDLALLYLDENATENQSVALTRIVEYMNGAYACLW